MKTYYGLSDSFTGEWPSDHTAGFANRKIAVAFKTKQERDYWLKNTKLITARAISRDKAIQFSEKFWYGFYVKYARPENCSAEYSEPSMKCIKKTWSH